MAKTVREEVERWRSEGESANTPALRRLERLIDVPQYGRERFRNTLGAAFDLKGQRGRPLHTRHPLLEEAIQRALLPSWNDVAKSLEDRADGIVEGLRATGWRKSCSEQLVEYAHKFTSSRRERRKDEEERPTWYS
jgi:hypothetical protein